MRLLVQKVISASVQVNKKIVGSISEGYLVLVGFTLDDNYQIIDKMIDKLLKLRIFEDENNKTNLSLNEVNGNILAVPQFTLYADASKGNRPSFEEALAFNESQKLFDYFKDKLLEKQKEANFGIFGADMKVELVNDGPFTIMLDSLEIYGKNK